MLEEESWLRGLKSDRLLLKLPLLFWKQLGKDYPKPTALLADASLLCDSNASVDDTICELFLISLIMKSTLNICKNFTYLESKLFILLIDGPLGVFDT